MPKIKARRIKEGSLVYSKNEIEMPKVLQASPDTGPQTTASPRLMMILWMAAQAQEEKKNG
jgi:hypothetical protein